MTPNLQACSFLLGRLEKEVAKLRAVAFPGHDTGPRKWLNFIIGLLETGQGYLDRAQQQDVSPQEAFDLIRDAERLGDHAYQFLNIVAGADATQIPHQVVAPFQRWVEALGITETIFFRAEHLPNYELMWVDARNFSLLNGASRSLTDATASITWPVLRVSVPGHAMGLLPHFAVVAHELGHAIQERLKPDFNQYVEGLNDALARATARLAKEQVTFTNEHAIRAGKIINSWINEVKSDAVGHYLVGPAFFFALCGFLELSGLTGHGYGIGASHPPSDFRRTTLFAKLSEGAPSFVEVFQQKTGFLLTEDFSSPHVARRGGDDDMYEELKDSIGPVDAALCVELAHVITAMTQAIFSTAKTYLEQHCPQLIYTPAQLADDLDRHLELLCNLVPPIEYMDGEQPRAASLGSIMNVGWAALLTKVDRFPSIRGFASSDPTAARMESLHELLLKAVELSEARLLWENLQ